MVGSARGARVHGEDTGTAANIEDNLVLEKVGVLVDRIAVASCADLVFLKPRCQPLVSHPTSGARLGAHTSISSWMPSCAH